MLGTPKKMWRKWSRFGDLLHFRPGSVMAMKRLPASSAPTVCFDALEEILLEDIGLERAAGFAGNDEQRLREIDLVLEGFDLRGIGGVEHVQLGKPWNLAEGHAQHFRAQARAAHAEQQHVREAPLLDFFGDLAAVAACCAICSSVMPSQPSQLASSVPVHSDASRCQGGALYRRLANRRSSVSRLRQGSRASLYVWRLIFRSVFDCVLFSTACKQLVEGIGETVAHRRRVSLSVTSFMEMPTLREDLHYLLRASTIFGEAVAQLP